MSVTLPHPDQYTYRTEWNHGEQSFVATVTEFPSLSWIAKTPEDATAGLKAVVHETLVDLNQSGGYIPAPAPRPYQQWQTQAPSQLQPPPSYYPTFQMPVPQMAMPQNSTAPAQGVQQVTNVNVGAGYAPYYRRGVNHTFHLVLTLWSLMPENEELEITMEHRAAAALVWIVGILFVVVVILRPIYDVLAGY